MPFRFNRKKAIHIILFVLHSLGKVAEPSRLFLLIYLAELKYLAKYGSLITGDSYVAMKYGPAPLHILSIFQELKEEHEAGLTDNPREHLILNEDYQIVARDAYNAAYLSESEVECLFETMQLYKKASMELLSHMTMASAWNKADTNGSISVTDMAADSGATPQMIEYISLTYNDELYSFNDLL